MTPGGLIGWDRLRHGGLLLDAPRLSRIGQETPSALSAYDERELRRLASRVLDGGGDNSDFVTFVLESVCGFASTTGQWQRGANVPAEWGRHTISRETVRPRQLWRGKAGGILPVFFDGESRIGIGRGRKATSQVLQWLRLGPERLALLTNGRQWRLIFAGLDFDAWCEWDVELWFQEGQPSPQVNALRTLISPKLWSPVEAGATPPLLEAILDCRKGQAELSAALGERVREAVELLVQAHGEALKEKCSEVRATEIYRAAVRMVMRMVVVLFAESRDLLPRDNALYHATYGLGGLLEDLEKVAARGGNRLARSWNAWPRVLALFRLVHQGSHHPVMPVPAYGGELFAAGDPNSPDSLRRAVGVFETACFDHESLLPDSEVLRILEKVTRTRVKIRQGHANTWVAAPVDFSDLSSEYIGILYEGLLDFELRTAPAGDPIVFLAVGNQPALPLSRLEGMDEKALGELLEKMKDTSKPEDEAEKEGEGSDVEDEDAGEDGVENEREEAGTSEASEPATEEEPSDVRHATRSRAELWARRAAEAGGLIRKPRGALTPEKKQAFEEALSEKARQLVARVVLPGEWFLVRWGGMRKGAGTFYTRPSLAVPTVQRTLLPLAYTPPNIDEGATDLGALPSRWTPRTPEEILALKVCDPACGSGTFPVASLRFLTEALYASVHHHGRITADGDRALVRLLGGDQGAAAKDADLLGQELLPCRPDDPLFEPRLKAVLRRYVVESSVYGVDIDPLAVELCRLALWIETMDRELPFSFLDHKVKCGNSLVGCWFDRFRHYPIMAWDREGGDKGHSTSTNFPKEARTKAIAKHLKEVIRTDLVALIDRMRGQGDLFLSDGKSAEQVHDEALSILQDMHNLPPGEDGEQRRAELHRKLREGPAYMALRRAFDSWCSLWFWPPDKVADAHRPSTFNSLPAISARVVDEIARERRFFHWELEFPDVFALRGAVERKKSPWSGFDAILGNPPWDTLQPNSKEWFSNIDPLFRTYGKQDALARQREYFTADAKTEKEWLEFISSFKDMANFVKASGAPFGDRVSTDSAGKDTHDFPLGDRGKASRDSSKARHAAWAKRRAVDIGYADPEHPFALQGDGKPYTYKLFMELALALLKQDGRLGFVVPSGLYTDHGSTVLRSRFLTKCRWEWLFGFENREKIFDIDSRFKFNPVVIAKGGETAMIRTAFMQRDPNAWAVGVAEGLSVPYARAQVERFSPHSRALLEIRSARDLAVLEKMYSDSLLLGDTSPEGWGIRYAQGDFNMTSDSALFPVLSKWEERGYRPDEYSRWIKGAWKPVGELWATLGLRGGIPLRRGRGANAPFHNSPPYEELPIPRADIPAGVILSRDMTAFIREGDIAWEGEPVDDARIDVRHRAVALPLYEGRMIDIGDPSAKGWVSGKGRGAVWKDVPWSRKEVGPQYLILQGRWKRHAVKSVDTTVSHKRIGSATNERSSVACVLHGVPTGDTAAVFWTASTAEDFQLSGILSSIPFDSIMRVRLGGLHLDYHVYEQNPLPARSVATEAVGHCEMRLSQAWSRGGACWLATSAQKTIRTTAWRSLWALSPHERLRLRCILDAATAAVYGLNLEDLKWILKDCDHSAEKTSNQAFARRLDPKGFWRVDKLELPERRHTVLTLAAFADLQVVIEATTAAGRTREDAIASFCGQATKPLPQFKHLLGNLDPTEGWMIPESLRLADLGLGHDKRAEQPQPVSTLLGPRFYDWQLSQDAAESWRECELHARNLLGEDTYRRLQAAPTERKRSGMASARERPVPYPPDGRRHQKELFE